MESRTAAAVLGVAPGASKHELRRAFRLKVKVVHPDADGSDDEFIAVREAFDLLSVLADDTPAPRAHGPRRPHRWLGATMRPAPTIDLTDVPRRAAAGATPDADSGRDARGLTFADHLEAQLAGRWTAPDQG